MPCIPGDCGNVMCERLYVRVCHLSICCQEVISVRACESMCFPSGSAQSLNSDFIMTRFLASFVPSFFSFHCSIVFILPLLIHRDVRANSLPNSNANSNANSMRESTDDVIPQTIYSLAPLKFFSRNSSEDLQSRGDHPQRMTRASQSKRGTMSSLPFLKLAC